MPTGLAAHFGIHLADTEDEAPVRLLNWSFYGAVIALLRGGLRVAGWTRLGERVYPAFFMNFLRAVQYITAEWLVRPISPCVHPSTATLR